MSEFDQSRAFLDEVLANPDDDVPRLIYADYLEEAGDPRGEFIRLQCELAELDELDPRYLDLMIRSDQLLSEHRDAWAGELKQDVRKTEFSRGFIDRITILARAFLNEAESLYQSTPVNWLRFNYVKGVGPQLAETEALSNVRSLDLSGLKIPEKDLTALLMSPHLANLESLDLSHYDASFNDSIGAALAEMPAAATLRHLELPGGSRFLRVLANGGGFPKLQHLTVGSSYADDELQGIAKLKVPDLRSLKVRGSLSVADTEAIAELPLAQLKKLDLESTRVPGRGLQLLGDRGAFDAIEELSLAGCGLGMRGVAALFQGQRLAHCRSLNLSRNTELREQGRSRQFVEKLASHPAFGQLRRLHISGLNRSDIPLIAAARQFHQLELLELEMSHLAADDLASLADCPIVDSLRQLKLIGCEIDIETIHQMARKRLFPNLLRLDLGGGFEDRNSLDEVSVIELVTSSGLPNVQAIKLDFLYLSSKTLFAIAEKLELPELRQISFCHNRASRKSIDAVMSSPRLPKLSRLVLTGTSGLSNRDKLIADYGSKVQF